MNDGIFKIIFKELNLSNFCLYKSKVYLNNTPFTYKTFLFVM